MSESQLEEIKATWLVACDRESPDSFAAVSKLLFLDMPALLAYAQVEVRNQTELKLEVLRRIKELSERTAERTVNGVRVNSTEHTPSVGT